MRKNKRSFKSRAASAKRKGRTGYANIVRVGGAKRRKISNVSQRVNSLYRMIETKESVQVSGTNVGLPHNNIYNTGINPFTTTVGAGDPMTGTGQRVGDQISLKGVLLKGFFENSLARARVHYRIMLIRGAKGETFDRGTLFKGIVGNKLIDQMNTERFTVVSQTKFTIDASNTAPISVDSAGQPIQVLNGTSLQYGGQGTKAWQMWIPGAKFGKGGTIQYENNSTSQVKFYDYRIVILAYDWYGTAQDVNNVGKINDMYCKLYFKDA